MPRSRLPPLPSQAVLLRTRLNDVPDLAESGRWLPPTIVQYAAECRAEPLPA